MVLSMVPASSLIFPMITITHIVGIFRAKVIAISATRNMASGKFLSKLWWEKQLPVMWTQQLQFIKSNERFMTRKIWDQNNSIWRSEGENSTTWKLCKITTSGTNQRFTWSKDCGDVSRYPSVLQWTYIPKTYHWYMYYVDHVTIVSLLNVKILDKITFFYILINRL